MPTVRVRLKSKGDTVQEIECSPQEISILNILNEIPQSVDDVLGKIPKGSIAVATISTVIAKLRKKQLVQTVHRKIVKNKRTDRKAYHSITFTR